MPEVRILHVNSYMLAGRFYKHLYREQEARGYTAIAYVPVSRDVDAGNIDLGYPAEIAPVFGRIDRLTYHTKQKKIREDLSARFADTPIDIIHAHSLFANGNSAMEYARERGLPYVVAVRGTDVNFFFAKAPHLRQKGVEILARASKVIFISEPARARVIEKYIPAQLRDAIRKKTTVVPNGIDQSWFRDSRPHPPLENGSPLRIMQVGDIWSIKDPLTTATAIGLLNASGTPASLSLVGNMREPSLANRLRGMPGVNLVPFMAPEDLRSEYRNHHVMAMPSVHETFGLVYAEAMSQGLPVIYTAGQGFDGQFPDGEVGLRVRPRDAKDVARAIIQVKNNYKAMSTNALKGATRFDWTQLQDVYDKIYESAVAKPQSE